MQTAVDAAEMEGSSSDVEKCAYRLRVMMSHLRDAKKRFMVAAWQVRCSSRLDLHRSSGKPTDASEKEKEDRFSKYFSKVVFQIFIIVIILHS